MQLKRPSSVLLMFIRVLALIFLGSALGCQHFPTRETPTVQPSLPSASTITMVDTPSPIPSNTPTKTPRPTKTATPEIPTYSVDSSRSRFIALLATDKKQDIRKLYLFKFGEEQLSRPYEDQATFGPLSWSPDGQFLVSSSKTEEETVWNFLLYKINVSTMQVTKLIPHYQGGEIIAELKLTDPAWSWDIPQITFTRGHDGIHQMALDGTARFLTKGYYPVWLDGSTSIAYLHLYEDTNGKTYNFGDMFRFDLDTKQEKQLTDGNKVSMLASSPDGKWIAFDDILSPGSINLMKSDGSESRLVIFKDAGAFSWDPDGNHLFFAKDCMIYRVRIDGTMIEKVDLPKEYCYWYAALQPIQ